MLPSPTRSPDPFEGYETDPDEGLHFFTPQPMAICTVPPKGWSCTRPAGHSGPCAASPTRDGSGPRIRLPWPDGPSAGPPPAPAPTTHESHTVTVGAGAVRLECSCGWKSAISRDTELLSVRWYSPGQQRRAWQQHLEDSRIQELTTRIVPTLRIGRAVSMPAHQLLPPPPPPPPRPLFTLTSDNDEHWRGLGQKLAETIEHLYELAVLRFHGLDEATAEALLDRNQ